MNSFTSLLLAATFILLPTLAAQNTTEAEQIQVPTIAVLPFDSRGRQAENEQIGNSVADLLFINLLESGICNLVERAKLDQALNELHLSAAGLVSPESQLQLGRLVGAKILISGSLFEAGDKKYLVAKIIGTETSRVTGCSASSMGKGEYLELVPELSGKVTKVLQQDSAKLLPPKISMFSAADKLSAVKGQQRKVYLNITEKINLPAPDPASEIELKKLLLALGFEIANTQTEADFTITCEAVASNAGLYQKFTSAAARVELSVYESQSHRLLATGATKETVAAASYISAAKDAIAQATLRLAGELLQCLQ